MKHGHGAGMAIGQSPDDGARFSIDVTKARDTGLYQYDATLTIYNSNGDVIKTVGPFPASAEPDPKLVGGIGVVESGQKTIADGSYAGTVQMGLYAYKADDRYWAIRLGTVPTVSGGAMDGVWLHAGYLYSGTGSAGCITVRYTSYDSFISNLWPGAKGVVNVTH